VFVGADDEAEADADVDGEVGEVAGDVDVAGDVVVWRVAGDE
jgi:hypothetical protein